MIEGHPQLDLVRQSSFVVVVSDLEWNQTGYCATESRVSGWMIGRG